MNCVWEKVEDVPGGLRYRCIKCGWGHVDYYGHFPDQIYRNCDKDKSIGPGTALHRLIEQLGFTLQEGCGCEGMISNMDKWGAEGCRGEHRREIIERLETKRAAASIAAKAKAGILALAKGIPLSVAELLDLAIQQSEQSQLQKEYV